MDALDASRTRDRVVLWFEHDTFDQLILARILAFFAERGAPRRLEHVQVDRFPGVERFKGLGELSPAAHRMLWDDRRQAGPDLLDLGARTWRALREPSPVPLLEITRASDILPELGRAVLRHLQELPWHGDGLSLTERLALQILSSGPLTAGEVFVRYNNHDRDVHLGLGDSMFRVILGNLAASRSAAIEVADPASGAPWHRARVTITPIGRRVLAGELDWLGTAPAERWVGGVRIAASAPDWRWDSSRMVPVLG